MQGLCEIELSLDGEEALDCLRLIEALDSCAIFSKLEKSVEEKQASLKPQTEGKKRYVIRCPRKFLPETLSALATLGLPFFQEDGQTPVCVVRLNGESGQNNGEQSS